MKNKLLKIGGAVGLCVVAGCASGPDYEGPRPGDVCYVSTESLDVHASPDGLSPIVSQKKYKESLSVKSVHRVAYAFNGDSVRFPASLVPCWLEVEGGYVPAGALASDWLIKSQDPTQRLSGDGMIVAKRGFSEEESGDMASMRGAAGAGKALATADYGKLEWLYREQRKHVVSSAQLATFQKEGLLSGRAIEGEALDIAPRSGASKLGSGLAQGCSSGLGAVLDVAGKGTGLELAASAGKTAFGLVWSESGPVQEFQLGESVAAKVLPAYTQISADDPRCVYVTKLATSLAAASNDPMPYRGLLVALVDAKEVNAFAIPGGFLIVTTGMLDFLCDEDELAAIIGHEIGHLELRHGTKAVGTEKILKLFSLLKEAGTARSGQNGSAETVVMAQLKSLLDEVLEKMYASVRNGYGVETEGQADWRSLQLCQRLGYDSKALYDVLERFKAVKGTYGGAGYPEQRGADILKYRKQLSFADAPAAGRDMRAKRYRAVVGK